MKIPMDVEEDNNNIMKNSKKRKKKSIDRPTKRPKNDRFKFIRAPSPSESDSSDDVEEVPAKTQKVTKKNKKIKQQHLKKIYESPSSESDDDCWVAEDMESLSDEEEVEEVEEEDGYEDMDEDESCEEEWETDTDYSQGSDDYDDYAFHESDCDEIGSDSDCDYVPPIEDKYVKKGDAIMYEGKGLDLVFGDDPESQIVEINEFNFDTKDDEVPPLLVDENGKEVQVEEKMEVCEDEGVEMNFTKISEHIKFYDCRDNEGVVVCLSKTVHFMGILEVRPILNSVQINGYTIKVGQSIKASSISHANYYLNLTPVVERSNDDIEDDLKKLLGDAANDVIKNIDREKDALIHLKQGQTDTAIELLKASLNHDILPHKNFILKNSSNPSSELILGAKFFVNDENPRLNCLRINEDWKYVEMASNSRIIVTGGKNTGKSTLAQYLINQNVSQFGKILLIDLDIGQPICGIAQTISATVVNQPIIGAGYLNSSLKPIKSFLIGDKSIMNAPFKYVECARLLIDYCTKNDDLKNIPWVINTMGYQKGFGLHLLTVLIKVIQPTDLVQIQHANPKYNFECIVDENVVNRSSSGFFDHHSTKGISSEAFFTTHVLSSLVNNNPTQDENVWISNASEKRKMSLLAQISRLMRSGQTSLNEIVPYRVDINRIQMIIVDEEYDENGMSQSAAKLDLFNGNLIFLCSELPLHGTTLECHGVGLVRAIDKIHGFMYVLMPQELSEKLRSVINVIAIGNIPLPAEILLKQNFNDVNGNVPHVTFFKNRSVKKYMNKRNIKDMY